jgi:recombination protein RecT
MNTAVVAARKSQVDDARVYLEKMAPQFQIALEVFKIAPERFLRVVMTALQTNPDLAHPDLRHSLLSSCMRLAQDGYLPDGVRAALVPFKDKKSGNKIVTPIKMIQGLREKVRESGELSDWRCETVRANDVFDYQLGDEPQIVHKPKLENRGPIIAAYSIATFKDGSKSRDVMSIEAINKRKAVARTENVWDAWPDEMCAKTVGKHHAKQLPTSNVIETFFRDDDELEAPDTRPRLGSVRKITGADRDGASGSDAADGQDGTDTDRPTGEAAGDSVNDQSFAARMAEQARVLASAAEDGPLALSSAWAKTPADLKDPLADTFEDLNRKAGA